MQLLYQLSWELAVERTLLHSAWMQSCTATHRVVACTHPLPHREASVGVHKALSAAEACRALNSSILVETYLEGLTPANAGAHSNNAFDSLIGNRIPQLPVTLHW